MEEIISFFEIPSEDFSRAVTFYEKVLNKKLQVFECETEKMACFNDSKGNTAGSISWAADFKPGTGGTLISLVCHDMESTLQLIEENGGKIITQKTKIEVEGRGYFALFCDSEGNRMGLYSDN